MKFEVKTFNFLSKVQNFNLGVVWILKGLLASSKDPRVNKKITTKKERERRKGKGQSPRSLRGKKKHKQTKKGSLIFLGKSLGKPEKDIHALNSPEN